MISLRIDVEQCEDVKVAASQDVAIFGSLADAARYADAKGYPLKVEFPFSVNAKRPTFVLAADELESAVRRGFAGQDFLGMPHSVELLKLKT